MRKYIAIITGQYHSTGILFAAALNALLAGVNGKILKNHFIISGKLSALKNVPHKKDIGTKTYVLKLLISSWLSIVIAATTASAANTKQLRTSTGTNQPPKYKCTPNNSAISTIITEEISPRTVPDKTLPKTNAAHEIGEIKYVSRV